MSRSFAFRILLCLSATGLEFPASGSFNTNTSLTVCALLSLRFGLRKSPFEMYDFGYFFCAESGGEYSFNTFTHTHKKKQNHIQ
jgi:hypothetical protein